MARNFTPLSTGRILTISRVWRTMNWVSTDACERLSMLPQLGSAVNGSWQCKANSGSTECGRSCFTSGETRFPHSRYTRKCDSFRGTTRYVDYGLKLSSMPSEISRHWLVRSQINRHKMTTVTPSYHMEAYGVDDNRYDMSTYLESYLSLSIV
jgi:hypothetical protein